MPRVSQSRDEKKRHHDGALIIQGGDNRRRLEREDLSLLGVSRAPAFGCHLFASKQRARTSSSASLTLEQGTSGAVLACSKLGEFHFISFGSVSHVAQRFTLWISISNHWQVSSHDVTSQQGRATQADLSNEFATVGHNIYSRVVNNWHATHSRAFVSGGIVMHPRWLM
jgi:hypothetical protein